MSRPAVNGLKDQMSEWDNGRRGEGIEWMAHHERRHGAVFDELEGQECGPSQRPKPGAIIPSGRLKTMAGVMKATVLTERPLEQGELR